MKKIPKWQTDKQWALRRAKRRKERLPEETEKLFVGEEECIIAYAGVLHEINQAVPEFLELSFFDRIKTYKDRKAANKIIDYAYHSKGRLKNADLENFLFDLISKEISSPYDWGTALLLRYAHICVDDKFPERMMKLFWSSPHCALTFSTQYKKRIPEKYELECLKKFDPDDYVNYALNIFNGRMPENLEELIILRPEFARFYAENVVQGILSQKIHNAIILRSFEDEHKESISDYLQFVEKVHAYTRTYLDHFEGNATVDEVLHLLGRKK